MTNKAIQDEFSEHIELHKLKWNFDTYQETLEYVLENNLYDTVPLTYSNIKKYMNKSLKEKLLIEFSEKNMIHKRYQKKRQNGLF